MKPTIVNHELRIIKLEYNSDKPLSDFETNALMNYIELHNKLLILQKRQDAMQQSLTQLDADLPKLEEGLSLLEEEIKICGPIAGFTDKECEEMGLTKGVIEVSSLLKKVKLHESEMSILYDDTQKLNADRKIWRTDAEKLDEEIDAFSETYEHPIICNYKSSEIYTPSFDADVQEFYGLCDDLLRNAKNPFIQAWNAYGKKYESYIDRVNVLFERVTKVVETANKTAGEIEWTISLN